MRVTAGAGAFGDAGALRLRAIVLVRRGEEAAARAGLRTAERAEAVALAEAARLSEAARIAADVLEAAVRGRRGAVGAAVVRAASLIQQERWLHRLREARSRSVTALLTAEGRVATARTAREDARLAVAEAVKRRQGAETEARRRLSDTIRGRERREEGAAIDAVMALRPRR